jgi:hypothetical protein
VVKIKTRLFKIFWHFFLKNCNFSLKNVQKMPKKMQKHAPKTFKQMPNIVFRAQEPVPLLMQNMMQKHINPSSSDTLWQFGTAKNRVNMNEY